MVKGRSVVRWYPAHVIPRVKLYMHTNFRSVAPSVFWGKKFHFGGGGGGFSCYHGNHFPEFLAHVLSWVKNYLHFKFQRNLPTSLFRMMVIQTDISLYIHTHTNLIAVCQAVNTHKQRRGNYWKIRNSKCYYF